MKINLLLIAGSDEADAAIVIEAARVGFPDSTVSRSPSLGEAIAQGQSRLPELAVLFGATGDEITLAAQSLDASGLPRWAVVAKGSVGPVPDAEVLPAEDWTPRLLARTLRTAMALHVLRSDRMRTLGDLRTLGIRITHDLRGPLGGIVTSAEALRESLGDASPAAKSLGRALLESAEDLGKVVSQVSIWAKASSSPTVQERFNMGARVGDVVDHLEWKLQKRMATVTKPESWPDVLGDPSKIDAVWLYLIENAMLHGGENPRIELGWERDGDEFSFWVADHGAGVPLSKQPSLYQPFHRLHETNAVRGLGLPIVERLVGLQGGHCGYRAAEQGGAHFFFTLPVPVPDRA